MAITFQCPNCAKTFRVKDELAGKKATCAQCKKVILVPHPAPQSESHSLESLASSALADEPTPAEAAPVTDSVALDCPFCFETVTFSADKAGKQSPCPNCRRIIKVPAAAADKPKADWRAVEHNLTMARKDDQVAPEGAWGASNQTIVSREALLEAKVVRDRKELAAPSRTKWYVAVALVASIGGAVAGWNWWQGSIVGRRMEMVKEAVEAPGVSAAWRPAVLTAAGRFYLRESHQLDEGVKCLRQARAAAQAAEAGPDRASLLLEVALAQAELVGDDAAVEAKRALPWEESQRELRQTLQSFAELPRESAWAVIEALTRQLGSVGPKQPVMIALSRDALPADADRAEALACVAIALAARGDAAAEQVAEDARLAQAAAPDAPPSPRLVALLLARKQAAAAAPLLPEATGGEMPQPQRLAYAEGHTRAGDAEKGLAVALFSGPVEQQVEALALVADAAADLGQSAALEKAVQYAAEKGEKFTLPPWALDRMARACERAKRPDLARKLADGVSQHDIKPWLELAALRVELDASNTPAEPGLADRVGDKTAAQALAWVAIARHNAKAGGADPRGAIQRWPVEPARPLGLAGSALGLQDRR